VKLDLSENRVSQLSPLTELESLKYLNLAANQINDIGPLGTLTAVNRLILDGNKIEEVDALYYIMEKGDYVSLKNNPMGFVAGFLRLRGLETSGVKVEK
jgi:internalin A